LEAEDSGAEDSEAGVVAAALHRALAPISLRMRLRVAVAVEVAPPD